MMNKTRYKPQIEKTRRHEGKMGRESEDREETWEGKGVKKEV